jgi:hypothetical protein
MKTLLGAAGLVALGLLVGSSTQPAPAQDKGPAAVKWEYKLTGGPPQVDAMNKLGDDGWELAAAVPGTDRGGAYQVYKRAKR